MSSKDEQVTNDKVGMFLLTTSWDSGKTYIDCLCRIINISTTTVNAVVDGQSTNVAYALNVCIGAHIV